VFEFPLMESLYYRDKETGNFYAMLRDAYNPALGSFPQADPVGTVLYRHQAMSSLGTLGVVHPELIALLYSNQPRLNHVYSYVGASPLLYNDPLGLIWPWDCYQCFKKQREMEVPLRKCRAEWDACKTLKEQIEYIEKYGGGFAGSAIYNCATQAAPDTFGDMIKSCGACGASPQGPWPRKPG
jgi:hypothetical protein